MLCLIWLALAVPTAVFLLVRISARNRYRSEQSWESLVSRLRPVFTVPGLNESVSPEQRWQQLGGAQGLCAMYQNAKVMLGMADFAARHSETLDVELLANLRSDALQIRVLVAGALAQYALHQLNEGISSNVERAASLYRAMSERMGELPAVNAAGMAAQWAGAH